MKKPKNWARPYTWREMDRLVDTRGENTRDWIIPRDVGHHYRIIGPAEIAMCSFAYSLRSGYTGHFVDNALPATPLVVRLFNAQRYL